MGRLSNEQILLGKIQKTPPSIERDALIDELETTPVHFRVFYARWLFVHTSSAIFSDCWTDKGYDPSQSMAPRNIQILAAADYGKSDIDNGGLHQFYGNHTGGFAPEMMEWLERSGLTKAAKVIREAMKVFGAEFPRSQRVRRRFLERFRGATMEEWNPFFTMDDPFYAATEKEVFEAAAEIWLRDVCGVHRLRDGAKE